MTVRSSAYDMRWTFGSVGNRMSCMSRLKSVSEEMEPLGTHFVECIDVVGLPLYSVYACLPERKLASNFLKLGCMLELNIF